MGELLSELMIAEHLRIEAMLNVFERERELISNEGDFINLKKIFSKFKWNLEKHFFVEERAIFTLCEGMQGEIVSDIFELMNEHGEILELIKEIEKTLEENIKPETGKLKQLLQRHKNLEDGTFYPALDKSLNEQQKQELSERIKEVLRG